jgi:hypothetical protein
MSTWSGHIYGIERTVLVCVRDCVVVRAVGCVCASWAGALRFSTTPSHPKNMELKVVGEGGTGVGCRGGGGDMAGGGSGELQDGDLGGRGGEGGDEALIPSHCRLAWRSRKSPHRDGDSIWCIHDRVSAENMGCIVSACRYPRG